MDGWKIKFTPEGEDDLCILDKKVRGRIVNKIQWFAKHFPNVISESLSNKWKNFYKLRVGDWRIVYQIEYDNKFIVIYRIARRDKIYKFYS